MSVVEPIFSVPWLHSGPICFYSDHKLCWRTVYKVIDQAKNECLTCSSGNLNIPHRFDVFGIGTLLSDWWVSTQNDKKVLFGFTETQSCFLMICCRGSAARCWKPLPHTTWRSDSQVLGSNVPIHNSTLAKEKPASARKTDQLCWT